MLASPSQFQPTVDERLLVIAQEVTAQLDALYHETAGRVTPSHPLLQPILTTLARYGKSLWLLACQNHTPEARRLKHWLQNLATAPVEEWRVEREGIKPLIRQVALVPRSRQQNLLLNPTAP